MEHPLFLGVLKFGISYGCSTLTSFVDVSCVVCVCVCVCVWVVEELGWYWRLWCLWWWWWKRRSRVVVSVPFAFVMMMWVLVVMLSFARGVVAVVVVGVVHVIKYGLVHWLLDWLLLRHASPMIDLSLCFGERVIGKSGVAEIENNRSNNSGLVGPSSVLPSNSKTNTTHKKSIKHLLSVLNSPPLTQEPTHRSTLAQK